MMMVGLSFLTLSRWLTTDSRRFMIIPMLCVTIFVILVVWFLLPSVARLMIHTPTAISSVVCLSMVHLMAVFICIRCILLFFSSRRRHTRFEGDWSSDVCSSDLYHGAPAQRMGSVPPAQARRGARHDPRDHGDGPGRGRRQGPGVRVGRRRLRDQAVFEIGRASCRERV